MSYKSWTFSAFTIRSPETSYSGTGHVSVSSFGRVIVEVSGSSFCSIMSGKVKINGSDNSGLLCQGEGAISKTSFIDGQSAVEIKILRLTIYGPNVIPESVTWNRKVLHIKNAQIQRASQTKRIGNFDFQIEPLPKKIGDSWEDGNITLKLSATSPDIRSEQMTDYFHNVCQMLSIAQRCFLFPVIVESYHDESFVAADLLESKRDFLARKPLVDWESDDTLEFLSQVHDPFFQHFDTYGLASLVEYYWRTHVETTAEIKLLYASVFMEALKFNWAANISTTLEKDLKSGSGLIRGFRDIGGPQSGRKKYKNKEFEELMILMSNHLGYPAKKGTFAFIENRNALFHSGLSTAPQQGQANSWTVIEPELGVLHDQIDQLLLRILSYSGKIFLASNPNLRVEFPFGNLV